MCAISGIFRFQGRITPAESEAIRRMIAAQRHRGPNDQGLFSQERILLGHCRLSILDTTSAGHQPFSGRDGTVHVIFNGEIYNFLQLRGELEAAGQRFNSRSDTEVLVYGYETWGMEGLLGRLRGMFALAIFDSATSRGGPQLILARDRFGIKPLYYFMDHEKMVFASEVRALLAGGLVHNDSDSSGLVSFLQLGSIPAPGTTCKSVQSLPPASVLVMRDGPADAKPYWNLAKTLSTAPDPVSPKDAVDRARELLETTVQQHLVSDVPLGIFLSGGIDSSALVKLTHDARPKNLVTLSVAFEEPAYNEAAFARLVASRYKTQHHEVAVSYEQFKATLPAFFAAMDQPTVDGLNTFIVSKAARDVGLTVVLSGLGADELFSGYTHQQKAARMASWVRMVNLAPGGLRRSLLRGVFPALRVLMPQGSRKLWCLEEIESSTPWWIARGLFSPSQIAELLGAGEQEVRQASFQAVLDPDLDSSSPEQEMRYFDYSLYLQNQLLKDSDAMSMAHSVELRVPFVDHALIEGILRLPSGSERLPWIPKRLLVEAMGPDFPREVWERPKKGFTFPIAEWMRRDSADLEALALEGTPLNKKAVQKVWSDFHAGRQHWSRPWMTIVAARWYGK